MHRRRILLINPTITSRRSARFPLSILTLAAALEGRYATDASSTATSIATFVRDRPARGARAQHFDAVGVTVMGGPQVATAIEVSRAMRARSPATADHLGRVFPDALSATSRSTATTSTTSIRGQGEDTLARAARRALSRGQRGALAAIAA